MNKKKCILCSNEISGIHTYCSKCYNKFRVNLNYYRTIREEWKLEAKQEDTKYFYFVNEAKELISGKKNIVIGRKGEGKTAIAQYIYNQNNYNIYTEKMTFKNFPFNTIYKLVDSNYTKPNQYISIWKYLIYTTICKKMIANENISSDIRNQLLKVFPTEYKESRLSKLIEQYTVKDFGFQILNSGFNVSRDKNKTEISWIEILDILECTILDYIDDAKYYIVFDELDEDYKNFRDEQEKINYFDMITGLFKAVQDIRTLCDDKKINILPIIFLRSDIYNLITYSDKNKWSDSIINIIWTPDKLKELIQYRLNVLFGTESRSFNECWKQMFGTGKIGYGLRKKKQMSSFDYILRSTQNRPRDFIKYFQVCAIKALNRNRFVVHPKIVREADNEFSEYMKDEIIDEIYAVLPEYEEIFSILSLIRKQTFNPSEFVERYNQKVKDGEIIDRGAEKVLKILFDYSVIGNVPTIKHQTIFKYEKESAKFNFKEKIIVHRGLYKALQIF